MAMKALHWIWAEINFEERIVKYRLADTASENENF
jgi:hypothetical protein